MVDSLSKWHEGVQKRHKERQSLGSGGEEKARKAAWWGSGGVIFSCGCPTPPNCRGGGGGVLGLLGFKSSPSLPMQARRQAWNPSPPLNPSGGLSQIQIPWLRAHLVEVWPFQHLLLGQILLRESLEASTFWFFFRFPGANQNARFRLLLPQTWLPGLFLQFVAWRNVLARPLQGSGTAFSGLEPLEGFGVLVCCWCLPTSRKLRVHPHRMPECSSLPCAVCLAQGMEPWWLGLWSLEGKTSRPL